MLPAKTIPLSLAILTGSILTASTSKAASIGVNFVGPGGDANGPGSQADDARFLQPDQLAGVVPAANWNNAEGLAATLGPLQSDAGITTATVTWRADGQWTAHNTPLNADPNQILTNGYIDDTTGTAADTTITFANLPFIGAYDVYLYYGSDGNDRTGRATLGATTIFFATNTNPFDGTFTPATPEDDGAADNGEYALFSGVTGTEFTINVARISNNVGVHGVQVVGNLIPEPTTVGLLSVGILGLLARRRRFA